MPHKWTNDRERYRPAGIPEDREFSTMPQLAQQMLARARRWYHAATLQCITHDVGETQGVGCVLVVEAGQIIEDGTPADFAARPGSRYRALLEAERQVRQGLWSSDVWRRLRLDGGRLLEAGRNGGGGG